MKTVLVFFLTLLSQQAIACLSASHNRIFPLGKTKKGLCVVEIRMHRTEEREKTRNSNDRSIEMKPVWGGMSYLRIYDKKQKLVFSQILDSIPYFKQNLYDSMIGASFQKGWDAVRQFKDFSTAKPQSISFCKYDDICKQAQLLFDTLNNTISLVLDEKNKIKLPAFTDSANNANNLFESFNNQAVEDNIPKYLAGMLHINSIRQFRIGNKTLKIVHICYGNGSLLDTGKTQSALFTDIRQTVFFEPVLHHGNGFDFYFWE